MRSPGHEKSKRADAKRAPIYEITTFDPCRVHVFECPAKSTGGDVLDLTLEEKSRDTLPAEVVDPLPLGSLSVPPVLGCRHQLPKLVSLKLIFKGALCIFFRPFTIFKKSALQIALLKSYMPLQTTHAH